MYQSQFLLQLQTILPGPQLYSPALSSVILALILLLLPALILLLLLALVLILLLALALLTLTL